MSNDPTYAPFEVMEESDAKPTDVDAELIQTLASSQGRIVRCVPLSVASLILSLKAVRLDMALSFRNVPSGWDASS